MLRDHLEYAQERKLSLLPGQVHTWKRCELERRSAEWGIDFQRNDRVPPGRALVVGETWAACIMVSHTTAEQLGPQDSAALWTAMSWAQPRKPVLVSLPAFGGDTREVDELPSDLHDVGQEAMERASSFYPPAGWDADDEDDEDDEPYVDDQSDEDDDGTIRTERQWQEWYWSHNDTHYRWFMQERARGVRWLSTFRPALIRELVTLSAANADKQTQTTMVVTRQGGAAIVRNEAGGRLGKVQHGVRLAHGGKVRDQLRPERVNVLVLASEHDRPAAVAALADAGLDLHFDPTPGWLEAAVEPGTHGWLDVTWRGTVRGVRLTLELATFHIFTGKLTVAAAELCESLDLLLRRNGFEAKEVTIASPPSSPDQLFGMDLDDLAELIDQTADGQPLIDARASGIKARPQPLQDPNSFESLRRRDRRRKNRKLRSAARALLPEPWAQEIEAVWHPDIPAPIAGAGDMEIPIGMSALESGPREVSCRLCDATVVQRVPDPYPYCHDCCTDAREGLFYDRGYDEPWVGAITWSLKVLAENEFGGPPAKEQLADLPVAGPNSDLLMLCRMLTARTHYTELGADRKSYAWTDWLAQAGLLTDGVRTGRGVTVIAKDGHLCRSLLERQVDDFFHDQGIAHDPEPNYPFDAEHNLNGYRADWKLADGTFVEALGFPKDPAYMSKADKKIQLAARYGISVVTVTHADLNKLAVVFKKWL